MQRQRAACQKQKSHARTKSITPGKSASKEGWKPLPQIWQNSNPSPAETVSFNFFSGCISRLTCYCFLEKEEPWRSLRTAETVCPPTLFFLTFHPLLKHVRSEISESPAVLSVPEPPASSPELVLAGATQPLWEPFLLVLSLQHHRRLNSHSNNSAVDESHSLLSAGMIKDEMASLISNEVSAGPLRQSQIGTRKQSWKQGLSQKTQPFVQLIHKA